MLALVAAILLLLVALGVDADAIDLFNLALRNGKWVIVHKSYWL
jgi:uncharacterized membrane protein YciS (DUF1049 family)